MSEVLKREARICQPILDLPGSRIRVVTRASADIPDMIKLWFGEGDEPTPEFIREGAKAALARRSEEHTSELQSLMRISYAVFCLKNKNNKKNKAQLYNPKYT